ncbi:MAG: efflux RND transporter periplasmic adaptor subunit [Chloroflexi bacterium]|nr:efflux RND transporter periplasmic adaptor subunit [Chloroflexota bacterium]
MQHKYPARFFIAIPLILSFVLLAGCSSSTASTETSGTGVVTETTMTDTVESSGSVNASQLATLSWETSGTVSQVNVTSGQKVKSGDVLMSLDSSTAPASVIQAIADLVTAKENLDSSKVSTTSIATAEVALVSAKTAYNDALGQYNILNNPVGSADYIAILKSAVLNAEDTVTKDEKKYNDWGEASSTDINKAQAYATLAQARIDLRTAKATLSYYESKYDSMDTATITATYSLAKAQLEDAQRAYDLVKNGDNTSAITSAQAKVDAAQATVDELQIIAPFDGEIAVSFSQKGDVVAQSTAALVLVNRTKLYIDVLIDETSISRVKVGNTAEITFDSLDGIATTGKVSLINPIGASASGVVNYTVRVELDKSDPAILIGATASVVIQTSEPKTVLFVPVTAVLSDAQGEYVIRITSSGQERVTVVSGQIVDNTVVVVGDLKTGDSVQTFTSTSSSTTSSNTRRGGGIVGGPGEMIP